jgi:hypothetical protein
MGHYDAMYERGGTVILLFIFFQKLREPFVILSQEWRSIIESSWCIRKIDGRAQQFDRSSRGMLTFPDEAALLNWYV